MCFNENIMIVPSAFSETDDKREIAGLNQLGCREKGDCSTGTHH
jgi:hypothetical protein